MTNLGRPPQPFSQALSQAIKDRGLSLDRIQRRLNGAGIGVSTATLSYWQSGRSLPKRARSIRAVVELESILQIPAGTLTSQLPIVPGGEVIDWTATLPKPMVSRQIIERMGLDKPRGFELLSVRDRVNLDEHGTERIRVVNQLIKATHNGTMEWAASFTQDADEAVAPTVEAITGCFIAEIEQRPEAQLVVVRIRVPRPVRSGELLMVEYAAHFAPTSTPSFRVERTTGQRLPEVAMSVLFHPDRLPRRCFYYARGTANWQSNSAVDDTHTLEMLGHEAQLIELQAPAACYGIGWNWADQPNPLQDPEVGRS